MINKIEKFDAHMYPSIKNSFQIPTYVYNKFLSIITIICLSVVASWSNIRINFTLIFHRLVTFFFSFSFFFFFLFSFPFVFFFFLFFALQEVTNLFYFKPIEAHCFILCISVDDHYVIFFYFFLFIFKAKYTQNQHYLFNHHKKSNNPPPY